jgi:CRP/FNR family transcriptional regulator, cyclic AMP receptor protein
MRAKPEELAAVPLFETLTIDELKAVASVTDASDLPAGTTLIAEDEPGHALLVLLDGTASVTASGSRLATLGPGDFFGEIALLGDGRRTATVTAESPVRVLTMGGSDFRVFERDMPEAAERLRESATERTARSR